MTESPTSPLAWVRPEIRDLHAYHVPPAAGLVKLDAMENPYTWPEAMRTAWLQRLQQVAVNRYPDPGAQQLQQQLRVTLGVPADAALLLGNGSDELIQILAMALAGPGRGVLAPVPTFVMYKMIATYVGMDFHGVPLRADFSLDLDAMLAAIATTRPALIFLAYPNNPTGNLFTSRQVQAILEAAPGIVVVDEAYHAFAGASFLDQVNRYPNLVVMRTLSKIGLAGLRLGLLAGPPPLIAELDKVRLPYNINVLTQVSAAFALEHYPTLLEQTRSIVAERARLAAALTRLGLQAYDSSANFILFRARDGDGERIFNGLKAAGILIKNLNGSGGPLRDCLRVTVGTAEENGLFLSALEKMV